MEKKSKIYIAGNTGLVGSALVRNLENKGYTNHVYTPFPQYDLRNQQQVDDFFKQNKPEYVIIAAAKVGGIWANNVYRAEFIYDNLMIQSNIIQSAYKYNAKKLLFLGSSCIYPKNAPQPIKEEYLLTNILEYTNEPYAIAKIAGIKMIESYNLQYGCNFISVMPTNLYGPNDNYDLEKSHVLPAIIRKMYLAKCLENNNFEAIYKDFIKLPVPDFKQNMNKEEILNLLQMYGISYQSNKVSLTLWGTGNPKREFLHSDDLANACIYLLENIDFNDILKKDYNVENPQFPYYTTEVRNTHINIGCGKDQTIAQMAEMIKEIAGFNGEIKWDSSKPDGTSQKLLDVTKLYGLGWKPTIELFDGLKQIYSMYENNID